LIGQRSTKSLLTSGLFLRDTLLRAVLTLAVVLMTTSLTAQRVSEIKRNQMLTVEGKHLINRSDRPADGQTALLVFEDPNVLVRLQSAVPLTQLFLPLLRFQCAEVGSFRGESYSGDWTVGKRCKLVPSVGSKERFTRSLK